MKSRAEEPARELPAGAKYDFGNSVGWADMPPEPAGAPRSLAEVSLEPAPGAAYTPSPADWRDEIFYSLVIDRFERAEPFTSWGDPSFGGTRHGGNLRGLIERLDYLRTLGVTAIRVNPVVMNPPAGYHQYWPVHFMAVDPQIGAMADFKELVAKAHGLGMRIVLDMVLNHTAPIIEYEDGFKFGPRRKIKAWRYPLKPVELAQEEHFSLRGDIGDWSDSEQLKHGDWPGGINHLNTGNPATQDILLKIAKWWIKETDVDGFRLDSYKHVAQSFWARFFPEVRDYAEKLGKMNFLLLVEIYDGNPANIVAELEHNRFDSAYNYPAYFWNQKALRGEEPTRALEANFSILRAMLGDTHHRLLNFIGNHDQSRFLRQGDDEGILRFAVAHALLTVGTPYLYYGDEQAFRQNPERERIDPMAAARDDMFPAAFDTLAPMFRLMSSLIEARKAHPALRRGEQFVRWSDPSGPGIYAFSRIHEGKEILVAINSAGSPRSAEMWVDAALTPPGAALVDVLEPACRTTAAAQGVGSKVAVSLPAYGVRVFVRAKVHGA